MSAIVAIRPARSRFAPTYRISLDLLIARYARAHATHVSPIVGCYQCLHEEPRVVSRELPAAA
jgi:hypothetical protein